MGSSRTTNNIFMRPLLIKIFLLISTVLLYTMFIFGVILTLTLPSNRIVSGQNPAGLGFGWYKINNTLSDLSIVYIVLLSITVLLNILISLWYKKADFSIGKNKKSILKVFTPAYLGIITIVIAGAISQFDLDINTSSLVGTSLSITKLIGIKDNAWTFTTGGWITLAISLIIAVISIFFIIIFIFSIFKKSIWKNKKNN